jgi:hypothetical protein
VKSKYQLTRGFSFAVNAPFKCLLTDWRYGFVSLPHSFNPTINFQRLINYTACYMLGGLITKIMNTYEIERKLGDKVEKWEFHSLQTENRELKSHVNELERKIGQLESINSNRYYVLERLFNMMAEHPQFSDLQNEIYQLKGSL